MDKRKKINKVICIGMHKTGTTSLGLALLELGYTVLGAREDLADTLLKGNKDYSLEIAEPFEALQDVPWALLYKELDKKYPGSKFILTQRDEDKWLNSALKHFGERNIPLHRWIYGNGTINGNEKIYLDKYRQHYKDVKKYFNDRPEDLLVISLTEGHGWKEICDFLGHKIPNKKFPSANKGKHSLTLSEKLYRSIRDQIPANIRRSILKIIGRDPDIDRFNNKFINRNYRGKVEKSNN